MDELTLEQVIGEESLKKLIAYCGGERIYIPKIFKTGRDECIKREFESRLNHGSTCMNAYSELSSDYSLSIRRIQDIINK